MANEPLDRAVPDGAVLDRTVLDRLLASVGGDLTILRPVIERYLAELDGRVQAVRTAAGPGHLARAAHALASPSATLGVQQVARLCRRIEELGGTGGACAAGGGDEPGTSVEPDALDALDAAVRAVPGALQDWLAHVAA
ncbi:MAG: Hpt domain-containing protein [Acidimicrobiales bacterium]